ncbi:hypothetical protein J6590_077815 [Homalodisca vitripennis]|nr:hypothetical protein J6590_077815 [Homalodisca vitripennis]
MESHEDSSYNSEVDSDPDSDPDNPEKLLNTWLGELDSLTVSLVCSKVGVCYRSTHSLRSLISVAVLCFLATIVPSSPSCTRSSVCEVSRSIGTAPVTTRVAGPEINDSEFPFSLYCRHLLP